MSQIDAVDLGGALHVEPHARLRLEVFDTFGNLENAAPVAHAELLHGGRYGKTDGFLGARGIGYDEQRLIGVESSFGAFDRGVEAFQVDAYIRFAAPVLQGASFLSPMNNEQVFYYSSAKKPKREQQSKKNGQPESCPKCVIDWRGFYSKRFSNDPSTSASGVHSLSFLLNVSTRGISMACVSSMACMVISPIFAVMSS